MADDLQERLEIGTLLQEQDLDGTRRGIHLAQLVLGGGDEVVERRPIGFDPIGRRPAMEILGSFRRAT